MTTKPKTNRKANAAVSLPMDRCQTPMYALDPLLPYIDRSQTVWEPCEGEGNLYRAFHRIGFEGIIGSDVLYGLNFFDYRPFVRWDLIITNPPYSIKYPWLTRCYELGRPFALLLPVDTIGAVKAQRLFDQYGVEIIYLDKRINFGMPNKGYEGSAQFPTAWFTWGFNIGKQISYAKITRCSDEEWHNDKASY